MNCRFVERVGWSPLLCSGGMGEVYRARDAALLTNGQKLQVSRLQSRIIYKRLLRL